MRIDRLHLQDFRRHRDLAIEPAPGLTIVRGPNEAGKSTIQQALEAVLFLKAESEAQSVKELRRWGSSDRPRITLDFEADGSQGRLTKVFAGSKGVAELTIGEEVIHDPTAIQERIHTLTGIPNESFFRSTASVGHAELTRVGGDEPLMQDRLQKAVSGADRGTAAAKKKLASAIQRYRSEGNVNPGRLKVVREEIGHLEKELASGEVALDALAADRAAWVEAHERRIELDERLRSESAELAEAERAEALATRRDEMQARYERARRGVELVARETELGRLAPTTIPIGELRSSVARAQALSLDLSELEADVDVVAEAGLDETPSRRPRPWPWVGLALITAVAAALSWFVLEGIIGAVALLILAVVTVVLLIGSVRAALRARQFVLAQELASHTVADLRQADRQNQEALRRKRHQLELELEELGVADAEAAGALLTAAEAHSQEMALIEGELRGLAIEGRDVEALTRERDEAANEAERAAHALAAMGEVATDPVATRKRLAAQVERTGPARDAARSEEDQALGRVDANAVDAENVAILAERLAAARDRQADLQRNFLMYQGTLAAIEEAEQATLKTAARYLEERMGPTISRVTDGRYEEIEVNEADLAFRVRSPESGELVDARHLSRGTADQLYLAARLGLIRLVTMERRPPLILDDPFVTFDAPRARRAITILREEAAEQGVQVLFLTWSDRYDLEADKVIELEAPPVKTPPVTVVADTLVADTVVADEASGPLLDGTSAQPAAGSLWGPGSVEGPEASA